MSLLASQAHQHHGHLTNFWCFWQCGQVASSTPFCAQNAHKCLMPLYIGAFRIIFLHIERLLIAFLVRLICHMVLPHYWAVCLKEMYFNFTAYIFLYKYVTCFLWMYFTTIQRAIYNVLPDLILHLFTFLCSPITTPPPPPTNFRFNKMIVHSWFF